MARLLTKEDCSRLQSLKDSPRTYTETEKDTLELQLTTKFPDIVRDLGEVDSTPGYERERMHGGSD